MDGRIGNFINDSVNIHPIFIHSLMSIANISTPKKWALHTIFNIINIKLNSAVAMHNNENPIHTHIIPKGIFVSTFNITLHLHIKCIKNIDRPYIITLNEI